MHKTIIILTLLITPHLLLSQSKQDYNWVLGYDYSSSTPGVEGMVISFDGNNRTIDEKDIGPNGLSYNNASISSPEGELLLYTNGCDIYNGQHELITNGDSINYNEWYDTFCDDYANGWQNTMILPDPASTEGYYILHQPLSWIDLPPPNNSKSRIEIHLC